MPEPARPASTDLPADPIGGVWSAPGWTGADPGPPPAGTAAFGSAPFGSAAVGSDAVGSETGGPERSDGPAPAGRRPWPLDGRLSLRTRLSLAASLAVAIAVVLACVGTFLVVRHELRYQVDQSLSRSAEQLSQVRGPLAALEVRRGVSQILDPNGVVVVSPGEPLPVTAADRQVAAGSRNVAWHDAQYDSVHLRVLTVGLTSGGAAQLTAPLDAVDATLHRLVLLLSFLVLGGVALAAALGMVVAKAALVPVDRLTKTAERVAATMDLSAAIEVRGVDEVARLGQALNSLLATVDQAQRAQRRLVADASHELRTPLTSLRTNLELLARPGVSDELRQAIVGDLVAQAAELSTLVGQLVDLEREPLGSEVPVPVAFDEVVAAALARAQLHSPGLHFTANLEATPVHGQPAVLERAVANLLDNAAKWSPPGGTIEVALVGGTLSVRDHGPGIDPADAPHVFDRFYRAARARALPGSGLGLSIVRQAAEDHGGQAWILPAPGGGTVACLRLPVVGHHDVEGSDPTGFAPPPPAVAQPVPAGAVAPAGPGPADPRRVDPGPIDPAAMAGPGRSTPAGHGPFGPED